MQHRTFVVSSLKDRNFRRKLQLAWDTRIVTRNGCLLLARVVLSGVYAVKPDMRSEFGSWYYKDNGFTSALAMKQAHDVLIEMAEQIPRKGFNRVIDFGCGNGVLLRKIVCPHKGCAPFGMDVVPARTVRAQQIHAEYAANFEVCSMFDPFAQWLLSDRAYSLGIFMVGRLLEVSDCRRADFLAAIRSRCTYLLTYFYGGWREPAANFSKLAQRCRLSLSDMHSSGTAAFVSRSCCNS
jgi:hypothetical protein